MRVRPSTRTSARSPGMGKASMVARARRSCATSSCLSAASSVCAVRFMARAVARVGGIVHGALAPHAEPDEELPIALDIGVAGGEELLAVEDRIGARDETKRLQLIRHGLA